jgi:hypothetical protein
VTEERCPCGRPLHYTDPVVEQDVRYLVAAYGHNIVVETPEGRWYVPRHYIALHGFKASEAPILGFEAVGSEYADPAMVREGRATMHCPNCKYDDQTWQHRSICQPQSRRAAPKAKAPPARQSKAKVPAPRRRRQ